MVGQLRLRLRLRLRVGVCVCVRLCARARLCRGGPGWASRAPAFRCRLAARPASGRPPSPRPYRPRRRPPPRAANLPPTNRRTSPPPPPRPRRRRWGVGGGPSRGIIAVPPGCRAAKAARMARGQPLASRGGWPWGLPGCRWRGWKRAKACIWCSRRGLLRAAQGPGRHLRSGKTAAFMVLEAATGPGRAARWGTTPSARRDYGPRAPPLKSRQRSPPPPPISC